MTRCRRRATDAGDHLTRTAVTVGAVTTPSALRGSYTADTDDIVTERYTAADIEADLDALTAGGVVDVDPGDRPALGRVAQGLYFRGLVHGGADEATAEAVREEFGSDD